MLFFSKHYISLFHRKVHIVELQGRELVVTSSTFVSLSNNDFNVSTVTMKVAESLNTDEEMILLDNQNLEIQDCLATQGKLHSSQKFALHLTAHKMSPLAVIY